MFLIIIRKDIAAAICRSVLCNIYIARSDLVPKLTRLLKQLSAASGSVINVHKIVIRHFLNVQRINIVGFDLDLFFKIDRDYLVHLYAGFVAGFHINFLINYAAVRHNALTHYRSAVNVNVRVLVAVCVLLNLHAEKRSAHR